MAAPPPTNVSRLIFRHQMFFSPQTFDHMLHSANPSSIQGFTMSSGSRVRNCTHEGWRGAVPLCQGSILSLPSSPLGEKRQCALKGWKRAFQLFPEHTHYLLGQEGIDFDFELKLYICGETPSFARPSDSLVALNHCQSPTVFRTE